MYLTLPMDKTTVGPRGKPVAQAETEIEVTPEMVAAGFNVLKKASTADELMGADTLLVVEIFRAMRRLEENRSQSPK